MEIKNWKLEIGKQNSKFKISFEILLFVVLCGCTHKPQTLSEYATMKGINIGCCAFPSDEAKYNETIKRECNIIVPENCMKFENSEPQPGVLTLTDADKLVNFARANNIKMRGHCLVWHEQLPAWVSKVTFNREQLLQVMKNHINALMNHYKEKILEWDVVNEAIDDSTHQLRKTKWERTIGTDFIDSAFTFAHRADPAALLFYNDYNVEDINAKSDAMYKMVKDMKSRGIPINGVGFQFHIPLDSVPAHIEDNFKRFAALGLKISITELDVRIKNPVTAEKLQHQKENYKQILKIFLSQRPACVSFLTWGITDKYSWIPDFFKGYNNALIFDKDYNKKPAYEGLWEALLESN